MASSPASLSPGISLRTSLPNSASSSSQFSTQSVAYARKAAADRVMVLRGPAARVCIARKHSIRIRAPNLDAGPHAPCERQRHIGTAIFVTSETWYALRVLHLLESTMSKMLPENARTSSLSCANSRIPLFGFVDYTAEQMSLQQ